jgi:3-oxoacyl-[acyl-carrier protein] reductase
MDLGLAGRVALVTGASRGIGRAVAERLGREGARVGVTYRTNRVEADAAVRTIEQAGGEACALPLDLHHLASIRAAAAALVDHWGAIDILVNNAVAWGVRRPSNGLPFETMRPAEWQDGLRANIEGAYAAMQAVLPSMRSRRWGRIVNVSSTTAVDGMPGLPWYAAAKAALHGLTSTMAREGGTAGVLVNVVMPGPTATEAAIAGLSAAARQQLDETSALGRMLRPEDVASVVVFLCSDANGGITGEIIRVGGPPRSSHAAQSADSSRATASL